jgi:hypothetical protein
MSRQLFEHDDILAYRFIPGLKARIEHESGGYLVRTNDQGFRCEHDFASPRRAGVRRVLLFGDSFTAGDGVSNKKRYGDQLERIVPDLEVFNLGLPGTGTDQHYLAWREHGRSLDCDAVVLAVLVENIRRVAARYRPFQTPSGEDQILAKPYYTLEGGELVLHHVPVPKGPLAEEDLDLGQVDRGGRLPWLRKAINRLGPGAKELAQRLSGYDPLPDYGQKDGESWRVMAAILERWIGEIGAAGVPVLICPLPLYQHVEETAAADAYQARFKELAARTGAALHDPLDDLRSHSPEARRAFRFEHDIHPTPAGHRALAESIAPALRALLDRRA